MAPLTLPSSVMSPTLQAALDAAPTLLQSADRIASQLNITNTGLAVTGAARLSKLFSVSAYAERQWGTGGWTDAAQLNFHW